MVDFNMQRVGRVGSNAQVLHYMALEIYDACEAHGVRGLEEPPEFAAGRASDKRARAGSGVW